jgi:hypothetical protein
VTIYSSEAVDLLSTVVRNVLIILRGVDNNVLIYLKYLRNILYLPF